jgi:hypothetical protein
VAEGLYEFSHDLSVAIRSAGDVIEARALACALLSEQTGLPPDNPTLAILVLTAACLHVHARAVLEVGLRDVASFLRQMIVDDPPARHLATSPMQFVQFAAAELRSLPMRDRSSLLRDLACIAESAAHGATDMCECQNI